MPKRFRVRIAVAKGGLIGSAIWQVCKGGNDDSMYIAAKPTGRAMKVSLHENRYCQLAEPSEPLQQTPECKRRVITSWTRPDSSPGGGWVCAASILIPPELLAPREETLSSDTLVIEAPEPGHAVVVDFIFSRLPVGTIQLPLTAGELAHVPLRNGEHFAIIGSYLPFDYQHFARTSHTILPGERLFSVGPAAEADRAFLFNDPNTEGCLRIVDVGGLTVEVAAPSANTPDKLNLG